MSLRQSQTIPKQKEMSSYELLTMYNDKLHVWLENHPKVRENEVAMEKLADLTCGNLIYLLENHEEMWIKDRSKVLNEIFCRTGTSRDTYSESEIEKLLSFLSCFFDIYAIFKKSKKDYVREQGIKK